MTNLKNRKLNSTNSFKDVFFAGLNMQVALKTEDAKKAVDTIGQYNYFEPEIVKELIDSIVAELTDYDFEQASYSSHVAIGREGSPVIYVRLMRPLDKNELTEKKIGKVLLLAKNAKADEVSFDGDGIRKEFRFWWD
jgi:hypothetical protein